MENRNTKRANSAADIMIDRIETIIDEKLKKTIKISSAIVKSINNDGTINIYFPPDNNIIFNGIKNQSCFELSNGDGVEVLLKDGTYNNCWIIAKHESSYSQQANIEDLKKDIQSIKTELEEIKIQIQNVNNSRS